MPPIITCPEPTLEMKPDPLEVTEPHPELEPEEEEEDQDELLDEDDDDELPPVKPESWLTSEESPESRLDPPVLKDPEPAVEMVVPPRPVEMVVPPVLIRLPEEPVEMNVPDPIPLSYPVEPVVKEVDGPLLLT